MVAESLRSLTSNRRCLVVVALVVITAGCGASNDSSDAVSPPVSPSTSVTSDDSGASSGAEPSSTPGASDDSDVSTGSESASTPSAVASNASALTDGLVAHYELDGDAVDERGASSGTLSGATAVADRFGNEAGALDFDGVDDYVEIPHTDALNLSNEFSIATWIRHSEQAESTWYTVFEKSDPERGGHSRWGLWILDDQMWLCYESADGSGQPCGIADGTIPYDEWHHLAAVRSSGEAVLYIDGEEVGRTPLGTGPISQTPFLSYIGTDLYGEAPVFLDASLDDVRIYNRALSTDEVVELGTTAPTLE